MSGGDCPEWDADGLFALASLASATDQHERAVAYAGKAMGAAAAAGESPQLSRTTFDRLTVSYKSLVDDRRIGWRTLDARQWRRKSSSPLCSSDTFGDDDNDRDRSVAEYARRLARETVDLSRDFCAIVDRHVLPDLDGPADMAHAHKLKADFYRYTYEVSEGGLKQWSAAKACRSYQRGYDTLCRRARCGRALDPARSDLTVNFAVCLERVFGAEHAAAFVRRALADNDDHGATTATSRTTDDDGAESSSLRALHDRLTATGSRRHAPLLVGDPGGGGVDLSTGFCVSDTSDAEPEF